MRQVRAGRIKLLALIMLMVLTLPGFAGAAGVNSFAWSAAKTVTVGDTGMMEPGLSFATGRTGGYSNENDLEVEQNLPDVYLVSPGGAFLDLGQVPFDAVIPLQGDLSRKVKAVTGHVYLYFEENRVVKFQVTRVIKGALAASLPTVTIQYATGTLDPAAVLPEASTYQFPTTGSTTTGSTTTGSTTTGGTTTGGTAAPAPSDTPTDLWYSVTAEGHLILTWTAPTPVPGGGYYVYRGTQPDVMPSDPLHDFPMLTPTFTDPTASPGHTYYYWIESIFGGAVAPTVAAFEVEVPAATPPAEEVVELTETPVMIRFQLNSKAAIVDGETHELDVPPQLIGGRMMVPLRFLGDALKADLKWDGAEMKVTYKLGSRDLTLWVNNSVAMLNGERKPMDVPPTIVNNRTLIPLRFVSENLNAKVVWDPVNSVATIYYPYSSAPADEVTPQPPVTPTPPVDPQPTPPESSAGASIPFGTFALRIPGASYSFDFGTSSASYRGAGTPTRSWITINADGTYEWGSAWDGKIYTGTWEAFNSKSVIIRGAQQGRDWLIDRTTPAQGVDDDINLYNEHTHYYGKKLLD